MRALLLAALLLPAAPLRAQTEEKLSIQPHLVGLHLGDGMNGIQEQYPPAREWPSTRDKKHGVTRYRVDKADAKKFPAHVQTLYLGMRRGSLVEIEAVYDEDYSRKQTYERLAIDYSLLYSAPHRSGDRFWWDDGSTVLRVFPAEIPVGSDGVALSSAAASAPGERPSVVWRTGVQLLHRSVFAND
jgi:hypothetical protein